MAINTDDLKNGSTKGRKSAAVPTDSVGGNDMTLAVTGAVQGQANEMAIAAQAAVISIDHAAEQFSDLFTKVMSGEALLAATLTKTQQKLEAQGGPIRIETEVPSITLDLPQLGDFGETRQRFLGLIGGGSSDGYSPDNPFRQLAKAEAEALVDEGGENE